MHCNITREKDHSPLACARDKDHGPRQACLLSCTAHRMCHGEVLVIEDTDALEETLAPPLPLKIVMGSQPSTAYPLMTPPLVGREGTYHIVYDPDDPLSLDFEYHDDRKCKGPGDELHAHMPKYCPPCKQYEEERSRIQDDTDEQRNGKGQGRAKRMLKMR